MNFPGPIDANLSSASAVSLDGEQFAFNAHSHSVGGHQGASGIIIPDKHLLFTGDYAREGNDLILSAPDQKYVVHDYFKGEKRPALISEDGAMLSGHIVSSLTGHVQYAQATAPTAAQVIGHVMKLTGSASVIRNGVTVELNIGDAVQKGDVVQTGSDSSIAMTLIDGSAFGMTSNARMVLNEMVYDPSGSSNSSFISLVQGTVTFVAGQTAKNGNMRVETPVATMGIRGTAVAVKIYSETGVVETVLGIEPDGHTGGFAYYDNTTGELLGTVTQAGRVTIISPGGVGQPATATEQQLSPQAALADKGLFNLVYQLVFPNFNPDANPKSTDHPRTDIGVPPTIIGKAGTDADGRATITYTIQVTNPNTHITTDVQIIAVNTPPQFAVHDVTDAQATVLGTHSFKLGDRVTITDPDIGAAPFFDVAVPYTANTGHYVASGPSSINFGSYLLNSSLLSFNAQTGLVTYNPEGFRFLDDGETAVYTFTFKASSGVGSSGSDSANLTLTLTVNGQNDAPTIVAMSTHASDGVTEDANIVSGQIKTGGLITFQDFDLTDAHTASFVPISTSINTALPGFNPSTMSLGAFAITPVSENLTDTNDTGSVGWSFVLNDTDPTLQSLAEGQTVTQTYKITVTDNNGVSVDQLVTVTITGTNDQPVIGADTAPAHVAHETPNTTDAISTVVDTVSGTLAFSDVDLIDTHHASAQLDTGPLAVVWSGGPTGIPQDTLDALATAMTATIGTESTNPNPGGVNWTFTLPDHLSDFLAHGETLTIVYDITVTDNSNTATSESQVRQVTVQVTAANDQPVITSYDAGAVVTEDLSPTVGNFITDFGPVTFGDADLTDTHTVQVTYNTAVGSGSAIVSGALAAALNGALTVPAAALAAGVNTFDWNFALDNSLVQYLGGNETITATYTIGVTDNSSASNAAALTKTVTVVINGSNDLPTITVTNPLADTEGNTGTPASITVTVADHVSITDVDTDDVRTPYVANTLAFLSATGPAPASGTLAGLFTVNIANGTVTYDKAAFDYLAGGEAVTATFNFDASSGPDTQHKSITVTINGQNDAPTITVTNPLADTEGNTGTPAPVTLTVADHVAITDVDASDVHTFYTTGTLAFLSATGPTPASGTLAGLFTVDDANGTVTYDKAAFDYLGAGQAVTATFNFDASSGPDTQHKSITVTINGQNDAPVASAATLSDGAEDTSYVINTSELLSHVTDVDGPTSTITAISVASGGGSVAYAAGAWTYTPAANYNGPVVFNYTSSDGSLSASSTASLNLAPVNDAPDFSGSAFGQAFVENGNPVQLVGTGGFVVHDVDNSNFAGGALSASVGATGSHIGDLLFVAGTDHIQIVGGDIQFDADGTAGGAHFVSIGTLTNHGTNLSVALNSAADAAAVMELTQAIRFSSTSDDPTSDQRTVTFTLNDGGGTANGGHDTTSFDVAVGVMPVNDAPVLVGDGLSIVHGVQSSPDYGTITKVVDLALSDSDEGAANSTISAVAGHGTVTYFDGTTDTSLASGVSATVTDINAILHDGITYTPTIAASTGAPGDTLANTDKVTVTVTDSHGASDTINFIFQQDGAAPNAAQLTGTTGKDLIFATQHDDALTGLAGQDNFVFASTTGQHTITDFVQGQDKIDLHLLPSFDAAAVTALLTNADHPDAGHTLLHLDGVVSTILVNNPALTANDFIIHPGASV